MSLPLVTVWTERDSPRLRYVLDWVLGERLGLSYQLTHDAAETGKSQHCIAYGWLEDAVSIHASSLLWETGIAPQTIRSEEWEGLHALYYDEQSACDIQFDLFAGAFYLLSRYEEYLPFTPDRHNRFPAQQSILYNVLERPVADEWVEALRVFLEQVWNISIPRKSFSFQASYDIDIAWSYLFKGFRRSLGAALQEAGRGQWQNLLRRLRVMRGQEGDPYDSFVWMLTQHMEGKPRPLYFVLSAQRPSAFDKNISPRHPRMASLISGLSGSGMVGLHPSYYSGLHPERLHAEQEALAGIIGKEVSASRQHYIRLRFPHTYRALLDADLKEDYSMGYSTHLGFRAGTSACFLWYDLEAERTTSLRVHPFIFMDTTAHYDLGLSAKEAFDRLRQIAASMQICSGQLITVMHNFSLGTDEEWKGWRREYELFLRDVVQAVKENSSAEA